MVKDSTDILRSTWPGPHSCEYSSELRSYLAVFEFCLGRGLISIFLHVYNIQAEVACFLENLKETCHEVSKAITF